MLNSKIKGRLYPHKDYFVQINGVRVYGSASKTILEIDFNGGKNNSWFNKVKGKLYLEGAPSYDPATQTLLVRDIKYTVDTKNIILKIAEWLNNETIAHLKKSFITIRL